MPRSGIIPGFEPCPEDESSLGTDAKPREWSVKKHKVLKDYLQAYAVILNLAVQKEKFQGFEYIDAFAGPGAYQDEYSQEYSEGSPMIALHLNPGFMGYHFIEKNAAKAKKLRDSITQGGFSNCKVYEGDANEIILANLISRLKNKRKRFFVFLDPYGLQVDWCTVKELAETRTCELFINFSLMGAQKNALPKDKNQLTEENRKLMRRIIGTDEWVDRIYPESPGILGDLSEKAANSSIVLATYYVERLRDLYEYCMEPIIMNNSRNAPIYALIFATHHPLGEKKMLEARKRLERFAQ